MTRLRGALPVVKQRQSSNTVEFPQVPFIERWSSTPRSSSSTHVELRAYVKPAHLGALTFNLQPVLEGRDGSASSGPNGNVISINKVSVVEVQWVFAA